MNQRHTGRPATGLRLDQARGGERGTGPRPSARGPPSRAGVREASRNS